MPQLQHSRAACLGSATTSAPWAPPGKRRQLRTGHQDKRWNPTPGGGHCRRRAQLETLLCCVTYEDTARFVLVNEKAWPHLQANSLAPGKC